MERIQRGLMGAVAGLALAVTPLMADELLQEAGDAQRAQAELQGHIDAADEVLRERWRELRHLEAETTRLEGHAAALAAYLEGEAERLARREQALLTLDETREALPGLERALVARLGEWVARDLPFLVEERRARVQALEVGLEDPELDAAERLERVLAAWRLELDYGRELDAWRGYLETGEHKREVEFLRLGRVGLYYLTPDGRKGGVWRADEARWRALDEAARREVRHGLRIARDQRAPALLHLPVSTPLATSEPSLTDEEEAG